MAYWWQKEEQKDSGKQSSNQQTGEQGYWWQKENFSTTIGNNITSRVNKWLENHNNYISNYQKRYAGRKYSYEDSYVKDSGSWLDTISKQKSDFDAEADSILAYMDQYSHYLDADWAKSVRDTLTSARGQQGIILENSTKDNEWWNSFANEELVKQFGSAEDAYKYYQWDDGLRTKYTGANGDDILKALDTLGVSDERDWLKSNQGKIFGDTIRGNTDFQDYVNIGSGLSYTDFGAETKHRGKSRRQRSYTSIDKYRAASLALSEHYGNEAPLGTYGAYDEQVAIFRTMDDKEFENLAYCIAYDKQNGTNTAEQYVDLMEETLSSRRGTDIGEKITSIDIPVIEDLAVLGYGAIAGVNNFAFGLEQFMSDEELAYYPSYYANAHISDSLDGIGYYAHSAVTNIGNMAPSILVSSVAAGLGMPGKVAEGLGSATMGVSAAGSAYKEALSQGYDKESARTYSNLVGASEGLLQYLIGGVSKLGGMSNKLAGKISLIDNALLRGAAKFGVSIGSEILEEEIQNFLEPAFRSIIFGEDYDAPTIDAIIETAIVTALSTGVLEGGNTYHTTKEETALNNKAFKQYGGNTDVLIQEGLANDQKSDSYKLAQKYQKQTQGTDSKQGKAMTGAQIRNLLAANQAEVTKADIQSIQKAAENRLVKLGQKEDVTKLAELATKYVTGQKLTSAERSFLANNKNGAQTTSELFNVLGDKASTGSGNLLSKWENDMSQGWGDNYSTEWAEGTQTEITNKRLARALLHAMANLDADGPNSYKSLESRVEADTPTKVSNTGKAVISATGEEIDLTSPNFKEFTEDGVVLEVNGKMVNSNEIDYATEDQGLAINTIGKIEHITPMAAGALYAKLDMTKPVMAQLNGMDEAFTYGFYNYSEADLKAGLFTGNLTKEQLTDAYKLGQYVAKNTVTDNTAAIKKMRTAAEATVSETEKVEQTDATKDTKTAPKAKDLTITYNHGNGVIEDILTAEKKLDLNDEQRAAIEVAKILHQMGLGTDFELFSSYFSKSLTDKDGNPLEVFTNDEGQEEAAYAGLYLAADGKIRINLNAYSGTKGLALNALSHELVHFIKTWSLEKYTAMAEFLTETYGETGMTMHQRVLREQARLEGIRGKEVGYGEAYDEVVANALNRMFDDGKILEKLNELTVKDKGLVEKILEGIKNFFSKFLKAYKNNQSLFRDTEAIMEMKEAFEQLQNMFAEALVDASENFQASLIAKEVGLDIVPVEASTQYSYQSLAEAAGFVAVQNDDGTRSFTRDGKAVNEVTIKDIDNSPIGAFINFSVEMKDISEADAKRQKKMFADICTMACKTNDFAMTMQFVGSAVFTGMKANADKQYGTTYDFPSICTKTQAVIDAMSAKMMSLGRGLNSDEIVKLYDDVFASGNPVPCPECYVFSRWIGIGGLLDNIKKYQDYYGNMAVEDVAAAYLKMKAEVSKFAEEQGISFGKAKGALTSKLTKEFNKLTEKIEKAENQGEKVKPADKQRLAELEPMMNTVKGMTWLENVYFADSSLKKVNPKFRVPNEVLFDLNNGEAFATQYKDAWAFRTTQGAGYGKAITPYAEARLGEGVLVTNNTTNAIKGRAQGTLNNYFLNQKGKLDKQSRDALKKARVKQKIQAFIGGQRFQSTSDARYENASDYLLAALEMQAMAGMVQCYTKVDGAVPAFSAWGFSINQSLMPLNGGLDADGNVKDTAVGGMKPSVAFDNRDKHETAGTITIGVNDNHIRKMFQQWVRDFIIPYHASGGKADVVAEFRRIQEGKEAKGKAVRSTDYSRTQSDKILSDEVLRWQGKTDAQIQRIHEIRNARIAILTGGKVNMTVVRSNRFLSALYDKLNGGEWDGVKLAKSKVESQIFPNEFWDQTVSYEESAKITRDYLEYCEDLGFLHRFSGTVPSNGRLVPVNGYNENGERVQLTDLAYKYDENGNKTAEVEEFFWKVLTDRRMYDNNGNYLPQKVVTLNDTTADTVTGFAKHNQGRQYDKAKAEALAKKIAGGQYSSQETDLDRITLSMTDEERTAILNKKSVIASVYDGQAEDAIKRNKADLDSGKIGLVKSALVRIGDEFGIFTGYDIADVDVKIQLSKGNIKESVSKDIAPIQIAKLLPVLKTAVENAIGIESHANRYFYDNTTVYFENLLGGYVDGEYFVPVRFGLKHSTTGEATLYVIVDQQPVESKKIKAEVVKIPDEQGVRAAISRSAFKVSVANLARFVNGKDLLRYLPDNMLSDEQIKTKWEGIAETIKKTNAKNDEKYAKFIAEGNLNAAQRMVDQAASEAFRSSVLRDKNGKLIKVYHGSHEKFNVFRGKEIGGVGNYFSPWQSFAAGYGDTRAFYLNLTDPVIYDYDWNQVNGNQEDKADGFIYVPEDMEGGIDQNKVGDTEIVVYDSDKIKSADPITYDDNGNVIPISERFNTENKDIRFSTQETDNITNRHLLANAFEGITNGSEEYKLIQKYKGYIAELNSLERKLSEFNREIRDIRFGKGEYNAEKLQKLESEAKKIAEAISKYDQYLLSLEASEPLRKVIERERKKEAQKTKDHVKEIQQNKKVRAEQTELRYKIRKAVRDLDKILNRGNKKLNVKEDMKGFASKALELADYLFTDHISNDELIRRGITVSMRGNEPQLVKETEEILKQLYDNADSLTDEEFTRLDEKRKRNMEKLRELLKSQRNERLNTPVYNLFNDLVTEYASLKNSKQDAVKAAYNAEVERFLRTYIGESNGETDSDRKTLLQNMRVADMTTDELWKLHNAYKMVLHAVRTANDLFVKGKTASIQEMADRITWDFSSRKMPEGKVATVIRNLSNKMGWDYEKLYYALDRIGSEAFAELVMNIANSENIVMQDVMEAAAFRDEMVKKYGFNNWDVNKEIDREFLDNNGKKFKLTLGQMMALYAYSRREGAWDHIEYGGFVFGEAALTNPRPADSYKLSKAQCEAITGLLTKEQKGYVEVMQKFLSETMGEKGNEVSMLLYGIKMFGEKNYFPIHIAGQFKAQANESQAKAAAGFSSMSNAGFTHAQNPNAKAPFVLEGFNEIWVDHVNEMSRYHGTVPALEDMRRVMNRSSYSESGAESMAIKQLMENSYGKEAVDYFDNLYREANSGAITDKLEKNSKRLVSLFRKNSVAYSLSVLVQQPASITRAYALIDKKYFGFKGFGTISSGVAKAVSDKWTKKHTDAYNEMLKYAPGVTMAKEIGGFDTATGGSIRSYLLDTNKSLKQKWKTGTAAEKGKAVLDIVDNNAIANLPNVADKIAWIEIWNACKREAVSKHKNLVPNSEVFLQAVGERFTEVIRATQVYDSIFAKSPMLKNKRIYVQMLTSFMNEPNTVANMAESAVHDFMSGDKKAGLRKAAVLIHGVIFTGVLKSLVYAMRDDDEDETYIEKYIEALAGSLMDDFNALNYIPLMRDVVSLAQGYDVERADMAIVADALDALNQVIKNGFTETEDMTEEQLSEFDKKCTQAKWKLAESLAAFFGIPVKNVRREIKAVIDHARIASANAGMTTKKSAWDKLYDVVTDSIPFMQNKKSKPDKLYEVIMSGDKTYIGRIKATYNTEDAYHTAVRNALRENDPRVKEAAQAHINGDPSERVRIAKQIIADGFDLNDVITAINSEISKLTKDDGEETAKKVKGYYKAEDFVREAATGDTASLGAIREDILQTAQANGKTAEEAEKDFVSDIKSEAKKAYTDGTLDDETAESILTQYAELDADEAAEIVSYWAFQKAYPEYKDMPQEKVVKYYEFAEPEGISLDVFAQFLRDTDGLATIYDEWGDEVKSKQDQVWDAINALPLTRQQKDALHLAYGYKESSLWDVPW